MADTDPTQVVLVDSSATPIFGPEWLKQLNLKESFGCATMVANENLPATAIDLTLQSSGLVCDSSLLADPMDTMWNPPIPGSSTYGKAITTLACCPLLSSAEQFENLPQASVTYSAFSRHNIAAVLVCATTLASDGSTSPPFLLVVGHPTVYPLGQTRTAIWNHTQNPWTAAILPPEDIQGPTSSAHVVMGNVHPSLRSPSGITGNRSPSAYLSTGTVICFGDSGHLFNSVSFPATSAPAARIMMFSEQQQRYVTTFWPPASTSTSVMQDNNQFINSADTTGITGQETICQMYRFVPLPAPVLLPYGPICSASAGFSGFRDAVQSLVGPSLDLSWLEHPLIIEFTNACKALPDTMSSHWISRSWIADAIDETSQTPGWEQPCDCDLWKSTERTLSFRLHHDFLMTNTLLSSTVKKSYLRYIKRAYEGNFTADSPLAFTPLALAGPIYFIRPPKVKAWDSKLHLGGWMVADSVAPSTRRLLTHPVPCGPHDLWIPIPLESEDDVRDRLEEEDAGEREPSTLATARLAALGKRNFAAINNNEGEVVTTTGDNAISAGMPTGIPGDTASLGSLWQPITVESPIHPTKFLVQDRARQVSFGAVEMPQTERIKFKDNTWWNQSLKEPTPHPREAFIDTNRFGHLTSPVKPSTGFYDRYDGLNRKSHTPSTAEAGFSSLRRSLYDTAEPRTSGTVPIQRLPATQSSLPGMGQFQDFRTPGPDPLDTQNTAAHCLPPIATNRSQLVPVSQWRLDTPAAGQPTSYGFLCALLFLRDVDFIGSSLDALSGGLVEVGVAERNFPADIWEAYRSGFLASSPRDAKHWLTQHENHVRSHMRHYRQQSEVPAATLPGHFAFERIPEAYFDHFRQGHWRTYLDRNERPSSQYFHAFAFLHLLPYHNTSELFLPSGGVPFRDAVQLLTGIYWFLHLPICKSASSNPNILRRTPLLHGIQTLSTLITGNAHSADSFAALWDSNPPASQLSCLFRLLQDVNQLFDIFHSLVRPLYGTAPFFMAQQYNPHSHQGTSQVILLSPLYAKDNSPFTQTCSLEPPNLLAAVASWDTRIRNYYDDVVNLESSQLRPIPSVMLQAVPNTMTAPNVIFQPPSTGPRLTSGPKHPPGSLPNVSTNSGLAANTGPTSRASTKGKRPRLFYRATKGFLSVVGGDNNTQVKSPAVILREASCTPKFPAKDNQGLPADDATCICFAYTIVSPSNRGCRFGDKCKFSHLDAAALPQGAVPTHFSALRLAIEGPLKQYYAFTVEGARVCS
jgi:hypothetical protein